MQNVETPSRAVVAGQVALALAGLAYAGVHALRVLGAVLVVAVPFDEQLVAVETSRVLWGAVEQVTHVAAGVLVAVVAIVWGARGRPSVVWLGAAVVAAMLLTAAVNASLDGAAIEIDHGF